MTHSMTAFATRTGHSDAGRWEWTLRSVNGRTLDLRMNLPDGCDRLETTLRTALRKALHRGTVTVTLTCRMDQGQGGRDVDPDRLDKVLRALDQVQDRAFSLGVTLGQPTAADVLMQPGVLEAGSAGAVSDDLIAAATTAIGPLLADLTTMRAQEGTALQKLICAQLDTVHDQIEAARALLPEREKHARRALRDAYARVMGEITDTDGARLTQELALIAVKQDVTEELDRLNTHLVAAWDLMDEEGPVGRKLDFIIQEMLREANTLCSKSQNAALSGIGITIKTALEQMREQVQNVE
ncbi:TIGR00255 family protein [Loktanella sp. DSM 29012]|uniref:YicC/YloC family endoribonuclease n=1 Tax=Loktanella sp. DSM 29012 TaxID=1881056 RepID=UPI0008C92E8A|nr:YicC/YloC family endoribonuclease [Loktanella sp. DSM 29012]SEQ23173.1 TIGR00255 family protein [Loktanella sp. DSM 29012]